MAESKKDTDKKIAAMSGKPIEFVSNPVVQELPKDYKQAAPPKKAAAKPAAPKKAAAKPAAKKTASAPAKKASPNAMGFGTGKGSKSKTPTPKATSTGSIASRVGKQWASEASKPAAKKETPKVYSSPLAANYAGAAKAQAKAFKKNRKKEAPKTTAKPTKPDWKAAYGKVGKGPTKKKDKPKGTNYKSGMRLAKGGRVGDGCAKSGRTRGRFV